jgi:hypothetical protein
MELSHIFRIFPKPSSFSLFLIPLTSSSANIFLFGSPIIHIYRAKDDTYVTRDISYFILSTYDAPPCISVIGLAAVLASGGHRLFWTRYCG